MIEVKGALVTPRDANKDSDIISIALSEKEQAKIEKQREELRKSERDK